MSCVLGVWTEILTNQQLSSASALTPKQEKFEFEFKLPKIGGLASQKLTKRVD